MAVSITEVRERARLLEAELARLVALSDSLDTRAGVAVGFAGVLTGLLVQVRHVNNLLLGGVSAAFLAALIGLGSAFPRRLETPDPRVIARYYELLPEEQATGFACDARLTAIETNADITDLKRLLLALTVIALVVAIILSALAVI
jgi:hypothetical protein